MMMNSISKKGLNAIKAEKIIDAAVSVYGITREKIMGKRRLGRYIEARHAAMKLTRDETDLTYKEIGTIYSGRDHSTVISAVQKIDGYIVYDQKFRNHYSRLVLLYREMMMPYREEVMEITADFEHVTDFLAQENTYNRESTTSTEKKDHA